MMFLSAVVSSSVRGWLIYPFSVGHKNDLEAAATMAVGMICLKNLCYLCHSLESLRLDVRVQRFDGLFWNFPDIGKKSSLSIFAELTIEKPHKSIYYHSQKSTENKGPWH